MLAFERWTLTHSSGWAAVLVGLDLALALLLGLLPELAAMNASREAETVAAGELCDGDVVGETVGVGVGVLAAGRTLQLVSVFALALADALALALADVLALILA